MATLAMLEERTESFLAELKQWPAEQRTRCSAAGGWCALQVLDHLVKTEEEILVAARAGASSPHALGIRDRLGSQFLMKVFQTDRRVKVPSSAKMVMPGPVCSFEELCDRWRRTRADFKDFVSQLSGDQLRLGIFRHPVAGWMGVAQMIDFFWVHVVHHEFQLRRLQGDASK